MTTEALKTRDGAAPSTETARAALVDSIEHVKAERERIRALRDAIPSLERRFNPESRRLWHQLDDWLNGLDAALTDAPEQK